MTYLLDTNIIVLALTDDPALPDEAREIINSSECDKAVSIASIWEITIKHIKKPEDMVIPGEAVVQCLREYGIPLLPIITRHIFTLESLHTTNGHKDPFDRLLIAQAKSEGMSFLTCDGNLGGYHEPNVIYLSKK